MHPRRRYYLGENLDTSLAAVYGTKIAIALLPGIHAEIIRQPALVKASDYGISRVLPVSFRHAHGVLLSWGMRAIASTAGRAYSTHMHHRGIPAM
jgi:hypothetical protein